MCGRRPPVGTRLDNGTDGIATANSEWRFVSFVSYVLSRNRPPRFSGSANPGGGAAGN
jgi:hypothetical protein